MTITLKEVFVDYDLNSKYILGICETSDAICKEEHPNYYVSKEERSGEVKKVKFLKHCLNIYLIHVYSMFLNHDGIVILGMECIDNKPVQVKVLLSFQTLETIPDKDAKTNQSTQTLQGT
jgi:hypothetical protein